MWTEQRRNTHLALYLVLMGGGRQRPSKVTGRGGRAEETPCQTTCAIASGPGFASTAGKQHGNMGWTVQCFQGDFRGFSILNQHWYNLSLMAFLVKIMWPSDLTFEHLAGLFVTEAQTEKSQPVLVYSKVQYNCRDFSFQVKLTFGYVLVFFVCVLIRIKTVI